MSLPTFPEKPDFGAYNFEFQSGSNKFPKKPRGGAYDLTDTTDDVEWSEAQELGALLSWVEEDEPEFDFGTPDEQFSSEPTFSLDFQWDIEPF